MANDLSSEDISTIRSTTIGIQFLYYSEKLGSWLGTSLPVTKEGKEVQLHAQGSTAKEVVEKLQNNLSNGPVQPA